MADVIDFGALTDLTLLGEGGQGKVYAAPHISTDYTKQVAYKEYKESILAMVNIDVLAKMPEFLESLPFKDGLQLANHTSWPLALVYKNSNYSGFIMPKIPSDFFVDITTVKGTQNVPAEMQLLLNDQDYLYHRNLLLSDKQRYAILVKVAEILVFLHEHNITVGDLSPKNLLFHLSNNIDEVSVYFVDCDAMCIDGVTVTPQLETPGWGVPTNSAGNKEQLGTVQSDIYKFSLLVLRLLAGSQDATTIMQLPAHVTNSKFKQQLAKGLSCHPAERGTMSEWENVLLRACLSAPNAISYSSTSTPGQQSTTDALSLELPITITTASNTATPAANITTPSPSHRFVAAHNTSAHETIPGTSAAVPISSPRSATQNSQNSASLLKNTESLSTYGFRTYVLASYRKRVYVTDSHVILTRKTPLFAKESIIPLDKIVNMKVSVIYPLYLSFILLALALILIIGGTLLILGSHDMSCSLPTHVAHNPHIDHAKYAKYCVMTDKRNWTKYLSGWLCIILGIVLMLTKGLHVIITWQDNANFNLPDRDMPESAAFTAPRIVKRSFSVSLWEIRKLYRLMREINEHRNAILSAQRFPAKPALPSHNIDS